MTEPIETVVVYHICQAGGHYGSHAFHILFSSSSHTNCLKLNAGCPIEPQQVKLDLDLRPGAEAYFVKHSNIQSQTTNIDIVHKYVCEFGLCISAPF